MKITFLGGSESIGASATLLEIDDRQWIIDCGIRMRGSGPERLPELSILEETGPPTAIFVTHAHLDHIGALPVLHMRYPLAPVYATAPTIALTRTQLLDSLRIMKEEVSLDGELPLYSEKTVESLLERMVPVTPFRTFRPFPEDPEVCFFPAGHILGACSVGISGREARVFVSGDISVDNQRTIPGMKPPRFRADSVVFESTYGKHLHPSRTAEEERLVQTVSSAIAAGGKVLIPAFAIGRAQEVILILLRAQMLRRVPQFPVYIDGMVRATCSIYSRFPGFLQSTLRKRIDKHGDPFFGVIDSVEPVLSKEQRHEILSGPPCAIVSSSGMLSGGPSPLYARALFGDPKNLIAITGYQDEESPGRRLLDFVQGRAETIAVEGTETRPSCQIASYGLSGHASGMQIATLVGSLRPADVFLVHGDASARHDLANLLLKERLGRIHLPVHGEPVSPPSRSSRSQTADRSAERRLRHLKVTGIGGARRGMAPSEEDLGVLAEHLRTNYREGMALTVDELYLIWNGSMPRSEEEAQRFEDTLRTSTHLTPHPTRLFQFAAVDRETALLEEGGAEEVGALCARIDNVLPRDALILKKSYQPGIRHMVLVFAFPDIAEEKYGTLLEEVFRNSGWTHELRPQPNLAALERVIRESIPDIRLLSRNTSVHLEERTATLHLSRALFPEERLQWTSALTTISERTGFQLEIAVHPETPTAKTPRDEAGRLEINLAYQAIRNAFATETHAPYRVGRKPGARGKDPHIEVTFISPEVGEKYKQRLEDLSRHTGWHLELSLTANQNAILDEARAMLRGQRVRRGPSFLGAQRAIRVSLESHPDPSDWRKIADEFEERTGYRLETENP